MQCCAAVRATYRKQHTLNGRDRGGVWILLFSEVTVFEYNVSTMLSPIVGSYDYILKTFVSSQGVLTNTTTYLSNRKPLKASVLIVRIIVMIIMM